MEPRPIKLPRSIPTPSGRIPVRLVSDKRMLEIAGEVHDGFWQEANTTIYVRKALSLADRIETFWHEMHHMVADMEWDARIKKETTCKSGSLDCLPSSSSQLNSSDTSPTVGGGSLPPSEQESALP